MPQRQGTNDIKTPPLLSKNQRENEKNHKNNKDDSQNIQKYYENKRIHKRK